MLGGSAICKSARDSPFRLGKFAGEELIRSWDTTACVDEYLQDQLVIYMALADGVSRIRTGPLTLHTTTALLIASHFVGVSSARLKRLEGTLRASRTSLRFPKKAMEVSLSLAGALDSAILT